MNRLAISYGFNCSYVVDDEAVAERLGVLERLRAARARNEALDLIDTYALAFLLAIGYRIPSRSRYETEPTTLAEFEGMTKMSNRHLRNTRDLLTSIGLVREGGPNAPDHADPANDRPWVKHAIYQLPGLAGPLFVMTPWDVDLNAAQLASIRAQKSARGAAFGLRSRHSVPRSGDETRHSVPRKLCTSCRVSRVSAGGVLLSDQTIGTNHHDDGGTPPIVSAGAQVVAEDLFAWMLAEYPKHNGDALLSISKAEALPILLDLLATGRTLDKLKAMTVMLWTCTERDRGCRWIAKDTDRSLNVLWRMRDTLDQVVSRPTSGLGIAPRMQASDIEAERSAALQRAIAALRRPHTVEALNDARQRAAAALEASEPDIAGIERELLAVASATLDATRIAAQAVDELQQFRNRMPADAYEQSLATCRARLLRDQALIPDFTDLLSVRTSQVLA